MTFYLSIHKNLNKLCGQWVNINISSTHAEGNEFNTFAAILFKMNLRLLVYPLWDNESFVLFYSCGIFTAIFFVFPTFTFETPLFFRQFTAAAWTCSLLAFFWSHGPRAPSIHLSIQGAVACCSHHPSSPCVCVWRQKLRRGSSEKLLAVCGAETTPELCCHLLNFRSSVSHAFPTANMRL